MRRSVARRPAPSRRPARLLAARRLAALLLVGALAVGILLTGPSTPLLFLGPWLLLLAPLLAGRYVGERSLLRLARAVRRRPAPRRPAPTPVPRRPELRALPRGGRLLACSLAVRPPPALA